MFSTYRSRSLSQDQEAATDGGIDIREKPSGNQVHSTNSSGHLVNKVTSSLHTASFHWETSPGVGSYVHAENGNVKSGFSDRGPDTPTKAFRDFSQPYFRWMPSQVGGSKLSTYTDVSSFVYRATDDQTHTYTLETSLAPTAGHPQLIPTSSTNYNQQSLSSSSATFKLTPPGDSTASVAESGVYYAATVCTQLPACSSHVVSLEPSRSLLVDPAFDKLQVLADKSTFHLHTIRTIAYTSTEYDLLEIHNEFSIAFSDTDAITEASTGTTLNINKLQISTLNTSLPTVISADASVHRVSIARSLNKITAELWHADREKLTSGQIYTRNGPLFDGILEPGAISTSVPTFQDLSVVPTGASLLTEESSLPTVSVTTSQSTLDDTFNDITWIPSVFGGFGDVNTLTTAAINHNYIPEDTVGIYSGLLRESVKVAYFPPSRSLENPIHNVTSPSIVGDNDTWLHSPQLTNIRNITDALSFLTSKHLVTAVRASDSSDSTLKVWARRNLSLNLEDTDLFPSEDLTFPHVSIDAYSDQLFTTLPEDDRQEVNRLERKAEANSSAIPSATPAFSDCLSVAESLHPTSGAHILPSHTTVNYRLSVQTLPIRTNNMEISSVSSIYLQPSSTYDYAYSDVTSQGNWNVNKWPAVFNDPLAETTSYQPLSLQSTTVSQAMTQDDASRPTISQSPRSVSPSSTMFITLEKSSAPFSVTDELPATGRVTTTQMNIADGGTSSKQVPNFNTTMIIASACAVFALVIFVIITICCLRRKRRSKNSSSRQGGDDLWVDLYRSNSSHQMPLPSLTTCPSSFEMTDTLKSGSTEFITDSKHKDAHMPEAGSSVVNQMKAQRQISSFQIKNLKLEPEQELEQTQSVSELGFFEDQAESWVKMASSVSMTSLPTTEMSYHTNVTDYNLAVVGHKFRAVYNYKPVCKGEMGLKEGELVECKERDRNGWMLGYKPRTNEEGWFPAVYVDELSSDDDLDFTYEIPETYDILESNKLNSADQYWTGIEHRVCFDYRSSVPGDLDLETGQTVIVLQTLANGWWFAVSGNKCGWFPGSYVEIIIDNSTEEPPSNGDFYQVNYHTSVSTETQDATATKASEDTSDIANASLASISELPEEKENVDEDQTKSARKDVSDETSKLNDSISTAIEVGDKHGLKESTCAADTSEVKSTVLTQNEQTLKKSDTHSSENVSMDSATNVGTDKSSHSQKRLEHSLRPARPAPPPPKNSDSKVKKDGKVSGDNNSNIQTSSTPETVLKKPVMLIDGKKPKIQKVLRSHLDEKQLNPMIRPSTRGFIPKPTACKRNGCRHEYSSTTGEHQSIRHDLHSERPMLSQPHSSVRRLSPFQPLSLHPLSQHEHTSSQTSLGSCPETRLVYPRGSTPHNEQDKVSQSNISYFPQERNLTPDYRRERSLTPDYKRDRSNSPVLLTTGNLLLNVQRFHGALKHPTPLGNEKRSLKGSSAEKRDREFALANTSQNTLSSFSRQQRAAPTTASNLKTPPTKRVHNKQTFGVLCDQNSENNSKDAAYNYEPLNKHPNSENTLPTTTAYIDRSRENMSHKKEHPSKYPNSDSTSLNQESFIVIPGTVSEIVQQINKHSPLQTELLQKLKCDKRQFEPSDIPVRQNILIETHDQKLLPTDHSQDATPNNGIRDVTSNNDSITVL
ncbi:hypothetical protein BsWGS_17925 [Bradybaena similaris]